MLKQTELSTKSHLEFEVHKIQSTNAAYEDPLKTTEDFLAHKSHFKLIRESP